MTWVETKNLNHPEEKMDMDAESGQDLGVNPVQDLGVNPVQDLEHQISGEEKELKGIIIAEAVEI